MDFEPFTRQENSVTNRVQGTGLGMAITKNIVDMMGGIISGESAEGEGSTFEMVLEFRIDKETENENHPVRKAEQKPLPEEGDGLKGMHFLCAEDNELKVEILAALLELAGASCEICRNGREIVQKFAEAKPGQYDMILMDVQMPVMNGYEATRAIRRGANPQGKEISILAMTANAFADDIQRSMEAGMNAHISKPMDLQMLEEKVREYRRKN